MEALNELIDKLIERLVDEGYIKFEAQQQSGESQETEVTSQGGQMGKGQESSIKFEVTDKGLDFLGFKTLKELVASLGKASFGRHDTNHLSTDIEASEAAKRYEFGDVLNLDVSATL